ncbi:uncharacterized protein N7503_003134 [Penicillium pulvis]|uniref:uncharacterized protein n=1 Tax=Penicillium pulvis TaxID=1562058 RepID=UPI0025483C58|nr:uncharacterized protein N7503_003134 [Penicillium pulvis]KAJ5805532.1 hypothetical protein N7503_003134 [Penicillium pulvis]
MGETCVYDTDTKDTNTGPTTPSVKADDLKEPPVKREASPKPPTENKPLPSNRKKNSKPHANEASLLVSNLPTTETDAQRQAAQEIDLPPGCLLLNRMRMRFLHTPFWGFVNGQGNISASFFDEGRPNQDMADDCMAIVRESLPSLAISDALVRSFMISVQPIITVVNSFVFYMTYDDFWEGINSKEDKVPARLVFDPTWFCAFQALLFAGAAAAPDAFWKSDVMKEYPYTRKEAMAIFQDTTTRSLEACEHEEHPTMYSLAASILLHHFTEHTPLKSALFVSQAIRLAQSMGIDDDDKKTLANLGDMPRLVWWHLVSLDMQISLSSGLLPCLSRKTLENKRPPVKQSVDESEHPPSLIMAYSSCWSQTVFIQSGLIRESRTSPTFTWFVSFNMERIRLHLDMIDRESKDIRVQGCPEKGVIPVLLALATPETHFEAYEDDMPLVGVLSTWYRVMITLLKLEVVIMFQKTLLPPPDENTNFRTVSWNSIVFLCMKYLQSFLHLCRVPAFEPYYWFQSKYYAPQQCALLILIFLKHDIPVDKYKKAEMIAYVDEILEFCVLNYRRKMGLEDLGDSKFSVSNYGKKKGTQSSKYSKGDETGLSNELKVLVRLHKGEAPGTYTTKPKDMNWDYEPNTLDVEAVRKVFDLRTWHPYLAPIF